MNPEQNPYQAPEASIGARSGTRPGPVAGVLCVVVGMLCLILATLAGRSWFDRVRNAGWPPQSSGMFVSEVAQLLIIVGCGFAFLIAGWSFSNGHWRRGLWALSPIFLLAIAVLVGFVL